MVFTGDEISFVANLQELDVLLKVAVWSWRWLGPLRGTRTKPLPAAAAPVVRAAR